MSNTPTNVVTLVSAWLALFLCVHAGRAAPSNEAAGALSTTRGPSALIRVMQGGREAAIHHSGAALDKSFIHPLWTPDHRCITYDAPADHIHHRGLCVGWPDVSGMDFWAEVNSPPGRRGRMIPRDVSTAELPGGAVAIRESNDWARDDGSVLIKEKREWRFLPPRGNLQIVDVDLALTAAAPEVVFGSDPGKPREYHGLTLRMGPFEAPRFFNSEGAEGDQNCHGKPARWCALSGVQSGRPVLAAILDHPSNDSHPTCFFVLGKGMQFISSSPNFAKPKILRSGETWQLRYRVIAAGAPRAGEKWDLDSLWSEMKSEKSGSK
jgi:hypothetical protein